MTTHLEPCEALIKDAIPREILEYIDRNGHRFHPTEAVSTQPWWSVYATVGLIFVGTGVVLWLLPCRRVVERLSTRLFQQAGTGVNRRRT